VQEKIAIDTLKLVEDSVLQEIDIALKLVKSAYETTESTRAARKFAEEALDAEQKKLEAGRSTSFVVLQLQKDLTDAAALEIRATAEYNKALHQLYFREGTTFERNKIHLEVK
jgi:outer membrane protein TolC